MKIPLTCRVLYAEDNEDSSKMMKVMLGFDGIEVVAVPTIVEAWSLAQSEGFDLFLLDSKFPGGDGLELCRRLRQNFLNTPIFFYSGLAYQTDKKNGLAAGADEYFIKPNSDNLPEKILSAIEISRTKRELMPNNIINLF